MPINEHYTSKKRINSTRLRRRHERMGRLAECVARIFLRLKGYTILKTRFRCPIGEIDIIARKADIIIAVEVKYRARASTLFDTIHNKQRKRIERALQWYVKCSPVILCQRFDCVLISSTGWPHHVIDAWRPNG